MYIFRCQSETSRREKNAWRWWWEANKSQVWSQIWFEQLLENGNSIHLGENGDDSNCCFDRWQRANLFNYCQWSVNLRLWYNLILWWSVLQPFHSSSANLTPVTNEHGLWIWSGRPQGVIKILYRWWCCWRQL